MCVCVCVYVCNCSKIDLIEWKIHLSLMYNLLGLFLIKCLLFCIFPQCTERKFYEQSIKVTTELFIWLSPFLNVYCFTEVIPLIWQDMMSSENDFPGRCHCLCRWYGLRDFVVLAPASNMEDILSESRANLLMSSIAIALHNTSR